MNRTDPLDEAFSIGGQRYIIRQARYGALVHSSCGGEKDSPYTVRIQVPAMPHRTLWSPPNLQGGPAKICSMEEAVARERDGKGEPLRDY